MTLAYNTIYNQPDGPWLTMFRRAVFGGVFVLVPLAFAVVISLTDWPLIGTVRWTGLTNYLSIASDAGFGKAVGYTFLYTAIVTLPILGRGSRGSDDPVHRPLRRPAALLRHRVVLRRGQGLSHRAHWSAIRGTRGGR